VLKKDMAISLEELLVQLWAGSFIVSWAFTVWAKPWLLCRCKVENSYFSPCSSVLILLWHLIPYL